MTALIFVSLAVVAGLITWWADGWLDKHRAAKAQPNLIPNPSFEPRGERPIDILLYSDEPLTPEDLAAMRHLLTHSFGDDGAALYAAIAAQVAEDAAADELDDTLAQITRQGGA